MIKSITNNVVKNSSFAYILQYFMCACRSLKCFKYLHRSWLAETNYDWSSSVRQQVSDWRAGASEEQQDPVYSELDILWLKNQSYKIPDLYKLHISFHFIFIYAFSRRFYPKRLTVHSGYTCFCQYMCSLGIEPTTFALLTQCSNHWATGTHIYKEREREIYIYCIILYYILFICNSPRSTLPQLVRAGLEPGIPAREAGALTRNAKGYSL